MSTAAKTIQFLKGQVLTARDAVERLSDMTGTLSPLAMFKHYFPEEFAAQEINWKTCEGVAQACCKLSELVDARLFPCCSFWAFDEMEVGGWDDIIFHAPFPAWYDDNGREPADFGQLEQSILLQCGYLERRGEELEFAQDLNMKRAEIEIELLEQLCEKKRGPVRWLPLAVRFFLKSTGNQWCDITEEETGYCTDWPTWNLEAMEFLRKEWIEALKISGRVSDLEAWMTQSPANRAKVEDLLRRAVNKPKAKRQRVRVTTQGTPLVEQMNEWGLED